MDFKEIKLAEDTISKIELENLGEWVKTSNKLTKGPLTVEFEKKLSNYIGSKYSVMVNSGSSANLLMIYALLEGGYLNNKRAIIPAVSWITTLSPFIQLGFEPHLCDADPNDLGLDINHFEKLCKEIKPSIAILVHVLGHPNKMEEISEICTKYNVILIEDACEALGSEYNNVKTGNLSKCGSFSFYYGHHISTIEGGAVTTSDKKLYNLMLSIRSHGWARDIESDLRSEWKENYNIDDFREYYTFYYPGYNLRSSDLNAFIGISQLDKMEEIVKTRQKNFGLYKSLLGNKFWCQQSNFSTLSSFAYGIFVKNRLEVYNFLKKNGIESRPLICGSMGRQPFWIKKYGELHLRVSDLVHDNGIYLPNHLKMDENKIRFVCEKFVEVAEPLFP